MSDDKADRLAAEVVSRIGRLASDRVFVAELAQLAKNLALQPRALAYEDPENMLANDDATHAKAAQPLHVDNRLATLQRWVRDERGEGLDHDRVKRLARRVEEPGISEATARSRRAVYSELFESLESLESLPQVLMIAGANDVAQELRRGVSAEQQPVSSPALGAALMALGAFDELALCDKNAHGELQRDALSLALKHELPLDIERVLALAQGFAAGSAADAKDAATIVIPAVLPTQRVVDALCFDVFLRDDGIEVAATDDHPDERAQPTDRTTKPVTYAPRLSGLPDKQRTRWMKMSKKAGRPDGYQASAFGMPLTWVPTGKRPYKKAGISILRPAERNALEFLRDAIERGRNTPVLPDDVLRLTAVVTTSYEHESAVRTLAAHWRVFRFRQAPTHEDLRDRDPTPSKSEPVWTEFGFIEGMTEVASPAWNIRRLYLPIHVGPGVDTDGRLPTRELIEAYLPAIRRWFAVRSVVVGK